MMSDLSSFDWQFTEYLHWMDLNLRHKLAIEPTPIWLRATTNRTALLVNTCFVIGNDLYRLARPGIQLSGSFNTSSTNSHGRIMMSSLCGVPYCTAMGDDSIETATEDAEGAYKARGYKLRTIEYVKRSPGQMFEFCSHKVGPEYSYLSNIGKTLVNYFQNPPDETRSLAILNELSTHPRFDGIKEFIRSVSPDHYGALADAVNLL